MSSLSGLPPLHIGTTNGLSKKDIKSSKTDNIITDQQMTTMLDIDTMPGPHLQCTPCRGPFMGVRPHGIRLSFRPPLDPSMGLPLGSHLGGLPPIGPGGLGTTVYVQRIFPRAGGPPLGLLPPSSQQPGNMQQMRGSSFQVILPQGPQMQDPRHVMMPSHSKWDRHPTELRQHSSVPFQPNLAGPAVTAPQIMVRGPLGQIFDHDQIMHTGATLAHMPVENSTHNLTPGRVVQIPSSDVNLRFFPPQVVPVPNAGPYVTPGAMPHHQPAAADLNRASPTYACPYTSQVTSECLNSSFADQYLLWVKSEDAGLASKEIMRTTTTDIVSVNALNNTDATHSQLPPKSRPCVRG